MRMSWIQSVVLGRGALVIVCLWFAGCGRSGHEDSKVGSPQTKAGNSVGSTQSPVVEKKDYKLVGEVRSVQKKENEITIRHEAIPGFMAAMTMPFHVDDPAVLDEVRPGDQVEGTLEVTTENGLTKDYALNGLVVVKPALAPPVTLDLSGASPRFQVRPKRLEVGEEVPDFTMTTQEGKAIKLSDMRGHVIALTFIYTRCPLPNFCPMMDRKFSELAHKVEVLPRRAARIRLLSVSFDPDHDTPEILREHARIRGAVPPLWTFAVADHAQLERIAAPLGLIYGPGKNEIIHNLCTAVIDPQGKLARLEVGTKSNQWTSDDILKSVYSLLPTSDK
jgi:protein SCO1